MSWVKSIQVILDASDSCNVANFAIDPVGSGGQEWDIKGMPCSFWNCFACEGVDYSFVPFLVTQFNCMDDAGGGFFHKYYFLRTDVSLIDIILGPPGCLQYFAEPTGIVRR